MRLPSIVRIVFFLIPAIGFLAGPQPSRALEVPVLAGRVNDGAHLLAPATERRLQERLAQLEKTDSTQIVVLTVPSLEGQSIEMFSLRVAETWKIGQKGPDNGALLVVASRDRKLRIEVGYGLEGRLTDLICARIIRNVIGPQFREGRFDQGVLDGVEAMIQAVRGEFTAGDDPGQPEVSMTGGALVFLSFFFFWIISRLGPRRRWLGAACGAVTAPIVASSFFGLSWLASLWAILPGLVLGYVAAGMSSGRRAAASRPGRTGPVVWTGFRTGGSGSSSGGFSGGGGGFGGGGASGGW